MWKLIDSEIILEQLKTGYLISEHSAADCSFQIMQIKDNGIIIAASTDTKNYMIIFPKKDLIDAKWWLHFPDEKLLNEIWWVKK